MALEENFESNIFERGSRNTCKFVDIENGDKFKFYHQCHDQRIPHLQWEAAIHDELRCMKEVGNAVDPFAVVVKNGITVVGHVPKKISSVCSLFLNGNGSIP